MLVQNKNLPNAELSLPGTNGLVVVSNEDGVFDVPEELGRRLITTPNWAEYRGAEVKGVGLRPASIARSGYVPGSADVDGDASAQDRQRKVGKLQRYRPNPTAPTAVTSGRPAGRTLPSVERVLERLQRGEPAVPPPPAPPTDPEAKPPVKTAEPAAVGEDPLAETRTRLAKAAPPRLGVAVGDDGDEPDEPAVSDEPAVDAKAEGDADEGPDLAKIRSREGLLAVAAEYGIELTEEQRASKMVELRDLLHAALYEEDEETPK